MDQNMRQQHMFRREYFGKSLAVLCGMFLIVLTIAIGAFLPLPSSIILSENSSSHPHGNHQIQKWAAARSAQLSTSGVPS